MSDTHQMSDDFDFWHSPDVFWLWCQTLTRCLMTNVWHSLDVWWLMFDTHNTAHDLDVWYSPGDAGWLQCFPAMLPAAGDDESSLLPWKQSRAAWSWCHPWPPPLLSGPRSSAGSGLPRDEAAAAGSTEGTIIIHQSWTFRENSELHLQLGHHFPSSIRWNHNQHLYYSATIVHYLHVSVPPTIDFLLSKGGHRILNMHNSCTVCCAYNKGKTGTNKSAQVLFQKNWQSSVITFLSSLFN